MTFNIYIHTYIFNWIYMHTHNTCMRRMSSRLKSDQDTADKYDVL